ncbi:6690_t:CDS:2 [Gigaspora margarita]|uniref:6690_t:CDS:1 n=1 Tax=Gigaspora margarita TaxID=4874 RepID=A0ABN7UKE0_GIGMA|nr:6690_t:CDS:2 [Gigaspora margarita]
MLHERIKNMYHLNFQRSNEFSIFSEFSFFCQGAKGKVGSDLLNA